MTALAEHLLAAQLESLSSGEDSEDSSLASSLHLPASGRSSASSSARSTFLAVHEQEQSPLFRLPPELRDEIYHLVFRAYNHPRRPYEANSFYCRPGFTHVQRVETALLSTCRKAYLEACHLPLSINTITFWGYAGPDGEPEVGRNDHEYYADFRDLDEDDTPWHFRRFRREPSTPVHYIRTMHWFAQQFWLECDNFLFATQSPEARHVEHLTVTLRRSDFWDWKRGQGIGIDPRLPARVTAGRMRETWLKDRAGVPVPHHPDAFGSHIRHMPSLKTLVFELETEIAQEAELKAIVDHALAHWSFLHHSGAKMRAKPPVHVERWAGPPVLLARTRPFHRVSEKPHLVKFSLTFTPDAVEGL